MDKPITVKREEFISNTISLVNTSGLPAFVMLDILQRVQNELVEEEKKQLNRDMEVWENYLRTQSIQQQDNGLKAEEEAMKKTDTTPGTEES